MLYLIARRGRGHATTYAASVDGKNVANFRTKEENSGKWLLHFLHSCIHTCPLCLTYTLMVLVVIVKKAQIVQ